MKERGMSERDLCVIPTHSLKHAVVCMGSMELKCLLSGETPTGSDSSETTLVREIKFWFLMISNLIWAWVRSIKKFK